MKLKDLKIGSFYEISGYYYNSGEVTEFMQKVILEEIDTDGSIWVRDKEGDIVEVLAKDLQEEIK